MQNDRCAKRIKFEGTLFLYEKLVETSENDWNKMERTTCGITRSCL